MPVAPYVAASSESEADPNHISDALRERLRTAAPRARLTLIDAPISLPDPVFPQYPDKMGDVEPPAKYLPQPGHAYRTRASASYITGALRGWLYPGVKSRVLPGPFHPIIAYLFTEWKCNLDCHARKGLWVYVPTNGRLMRPEVIDRRTASRELAADSRIEGRALRPARWVKSCPGVVTCGWGVRNGQAPRAEPRSYSDSRRDLQKSYKPRITPQCGVLQDKVGCPPAVLGPKKQPSAWHSRLRGAFGQAACLTRRRYAGTLSDLSRSRVSGNLRTSQMSATACSLGLLRPCSHRSRVLGLTPILKANTWRDIRSPSRVSRTNSASTGGRVIGSTSWVRSVNRPSRCSRMARTPATISSNSLRRRGAFAGFVLAMDYLPPDRRRARCRVSASIAALRARLSVGLSSSTSSLPYMVISQI